MSTDQITAEIVAEHGLTPDEYQTLLGIMGREPNINELGIFSVMWSEHCSYKSSRKWLKTLPTDGPQVIQGPGENAGVVDIGDGRAVVFKIDVDVADDLSIFVVVHESNDIKVTGTVEVARFES